MKCPSCGYNFDKKFNPSRSIQDLRLKRGKSTKKLLKKAVNKITVNIPSDNSLMQEYYFYQSISQIPDDVVEWTLNWYLQQKFYYKGKGFKYLQKMVFNHEKNRDTLKKHEKLMYGKPPKTIDFSRKESE
tara:strand:- start:79 stop:468 length:390 start_codon:yes stop_codon:yes gene_type:complete